MLASRPTRNDSLRWEDNDNGEVQVFIERQETWKVKLLSKVFYIPKERKITLDLDGKAPDWLANAGFDPVYGARPLKRAIQQRLENRLALAILDGSFSTGDTIEVDWAGEQPAFKRGTVQAA